MLNIVILSIVIVSVAVLSVVILSVAMLSVIMLSVVAPLKQPVVKVNFFFVTDALAIKFRVFVPGLACYSWVKLGALPSGAPLG
jgi:hypothetical protein